MSLFSGDPRKDAERLNKIIMQSKGSPEGQIAAVPGTLCLNQSGGASTTLYVKESGVGKTGWVAK